MDANDKYVVCPLDDFTYEDAETFDDLTEAEIFAQNEAGLDMGPYGIWDTETEKLIAITYEGELFEK